MPERDDSRGRKPDDKGQPETRMAGPGVYMSGLDHTIRSEDTPNPSGPRESSKSRKDDE